MNIASTKSDIRTSQTRLQLL